MIASSPHELYLRNVSDYPARTAWIGVSGEHRTWAQLANLVGDVATQLRDQGVRRGDRILTRIPNGLDAVVTAIAIQAIDAVESPIDVRTPDDQAEHQLEQLESRWFLRQNDLGSLALGRSEITVDFASTTAASTKPSLGQTNRLGPPQRSADAPACILWTSGTTREPKGVVLSKRALAMNALGKLEAAPQVSGDRRLTVLPLCHAYARTCDLLTWLASGSVLAAGVGWQAIESLARVVKPTLLNAVPQLIDRICGTDEADAPGPLRERLAALGLDELRLLGCGGAALAEHRFEQLRSVGIISIQGYGLTETGPVVCSASPEDASPGSVGKPIRGVTTRISHSGELEIKTPYLMTGYWNDSASTAARFTEDGWFCTGDAVRCRADGTYEIEGRLDEVLVFPSGRKLYPVAIERELTRVCSLDHLMVLRDGDRIELLVPRATTLQQIQQLSEAFERMRTSRPGLPKLSRVRVDNVDWNASTGQLTLKGTLKRLVIQKRKKGPGPEIGP